MSIFSIGLYACNFFSFPCSFLANCFAIAYVFALLHDMWAKHHWICLIINTTYISIRYLEVFTVFLSCAVNMPATHPLFF